MELILEQWGEQGKLVIDACCNANAQPMTNNKFLDHCTACGGDWCSMLLTGIKTLYPAVYDAIPNNMGHKAFFCLVEVLGLLNISDEIEEWPVQ